jgi:hypothetical protein
VSGSDGALEGSRKRVGRPSTTAVQCEEVEWLLDGGEGLAGVCASLRLQPKSLKNLLQRGGRLDLWRRVAPREHLEPESWRG